MLTSSPTSAASTTFFRFKYMSLFTLSEESPVIHDAIQYFYLCKTEILRDMTGTFRDD